MKRNSKKGFTLTELVVVIVIIGILAAVLIPTLTSYISRSRKSAAEQNAQAALSQMLGDVLEIKGNDVYLEVSDYVYKHDIQVVTGDYIVTFEKGQLVEKDTKKKTDSSIPTTNILEEKTDGWKFTAVDTIDFVTNTTGYLEYGFTYTEPSSSETIGSIEDIKKAVSA